MDNFEQKYYLHHGCNFFFFGKFQSFLTVSTIIPSMLDLFLLLLIIN